MQITDMNWMQVEAYLEHDDRCVLPLGSVEQHAYLSLAVDSILSQKIAVDAAEPLGIPVFPNSFLLKSRCNKWWVGILLGWFLLNFSYFPV